MTDFETRCFIISEVWQTQRNNIQWKDFFDYNDIGLPLGFILDEKIVEPSEISIRYIDETFELLVETLGLSDDTGFDNFQEMLDEAKDVEVDDEE